MMEIPVRRAFLREIIYQSDYALLAWDQFRNPLGQQPPVPGVMLWYHIQQFLVSAAIVAKILWAPYPKGDKGFRERCLDRAKELRDALEVEENSPLANMELRNHLEHFDERIQKWADESGSLNIFDLNLAWGEGITGFSPFVSGGHPTEGWRNLQGPPPVATLFGASYRLQPVAAELAGIRLKAMARMDTDMAQEVREMHQRQAQQSVSSSPSQPNPVTGGAGSQNP